MNITHYLEKHANERPLQAAIIQGQESIDYRSFFIRVKKSTTFFHQQNIKEKDTVIMLVPMSIDLYVIILALWQMGVTILFLDPSANKDIIQHCYNKLQPKAFIGIRKAHLLRLTSSVFRSTPQFISTDYLPFSKNYRRHLTCKETTAITDLPSDFPALITLTSGSTSMPKLVVRTHGFLAKQKEILEKTLHLEPGQKDLATLPIFALINLACGLTTIIPNANTAKPSSLTTKILEKEICQHQPYSIVASPVVFENLSTTQNKNISSIIKKIYTGGAPVYPQLLEKLSNLLPNTAINAVYGSTEAEPISEYEIKEIPELAKKAMNEGKGLLAGPVIKEIKCHIWKNVPDTITEVVTEQEAQRYQCQTLEAGEIIITGPHVLKGYLNGIGDTENKIKYQEDIWHRTGDLGYFDQNHQLWLLGRKTAKIEDQHGVLYPFALETSLQQFSQIKKCAIVSVENNRILLVESTLTVEELKNLLKDHLTTHHISHILTGKIPMDRRHNSKVDYPKLMSLLKRKSI